MKIQQTMMVVALIAILIFAIIGLALLQIFTPTTQIDTTDTPDTQDTSVDTSDQGTTDTTTDTEETNNTAHTTVDVEESPCESSLITCGCHAAGTSPESQGLMGGINCYGLYGLTGCEEIDGICYPVFENPGVEVNKSVYAMVETVEITFKPPTGTGGSEVTCGKPWKIERYINGAWIELQIEKFDIYNECQNGEVVTIAEGFCPYTMLTPNTKVLRDTWDLHYWIEEPQMCNGEIFTGTRQVNTGPGHYRISWDYSPDFDLEFGSAEFQVTS